MIPSHTGFRTEHVLPSRRTTDEPALSDDARQALKEASRMSPRRHVVAFAAKSRRIIRRMVPFLAAVVLVVAGNLNAQSITGSISGSVRDSSSLAVAGASATLISIATGAQRGALSDTQGDFIFAAVAPGPYLLKLQVPGFKTIERSSITLAASEHLALATSFSKSGARSRKLPLRRKAPPCKVRVRSALRNSPPIRSKTW